MCEGEQLWGRACALRASPLVSEQGAAAVQEMRLASFELHYKMQLTKHLSVVAAPVRDSILAHSATARGSNKGERGTRELQSADSTQGDDQLTTQRAEPQMHMNVASCHESSTGASQEPEKAVAGAARGMTNSVEGSTSCARVADLLAQVPPLTCAGPCLL